MPNDNEKFLDAEQSAQDLLNTLDQLKSESTSYKNSVNELDTVRQKLIGLIDSVQAIAKDSNEVIKLIKSIGGPEILSRVNNLSEKLDNQVNTLSEQLSRVRKLIMIGISISSMAVIGILYIILR